MPPAATADPSFTGRNSHSWLLRLAYDGTRYAGWQVQPGRKTVQGELSHALHSLFGCDDIRPYGCSRTDAGVHALAQMVSVRLPQIPAIPVAVGCKVINSRLPEDIRVLTAEERGPAFQVRDLVCGKAYTYVIHSGRLNCPFSHRYCWQYKHELSPERMREAVSHLCGYHDFSAFTVTAREPVPRDPHCHLHGWQVREEGGMILLTVVGDRFLYRMVRRLVGFVVEVGRGRFAPEIGTKLLQGGDREGTPFLTASPQGLFLEETFTDTNSLREYKSAGMPFLRLLTGS